MDPSKETKSSKCRKSGQSEMNEAAQVSSKSTFNKNILPSDKGLQAALDDPKEITVVTEVEEDEVNEKTSSNKDEFSTNGGLRTMDVICARGSNYHKHPGNRRYLLIVKSLQESYQATQQKASKTKITRSVIQKVKENGSRFVEFNKDTKTWSELGERAEREKVSHALRGGSCEPRQRRQRKRGRQVSYDETEDDTEECFSNQKNHSNKHVRPVASEEKISKMARLSESIDVAARGAISKSTSQASDATVVVEANNYEREEVIPMDLEDNESKIEKRKTNQVHRSTQNYFILSDQDMGSFPEYDDCSVFSEITALPSITPKSDVVDRITTGEERPSTLDQGFPSSIPSPTTFNEYQAFFRRPRNNNSSSGCHNCCCCCCLRHRRNRNNSFVYSSRCFGVEETSNVHGEELNHVDQAIMFNHILLPTGHKCTSYSPYSCPESLQCGVESKTRSKMPGDLDLLTPFHFETESIFHNNDFDDFLFAFGGGDNPRQQDTDENHNNDEHVLPLSFWTFMADNLSTETDSNDDDVEDLTPTPYTPVGRDFDTITCFDPVPIIPERKEQEEKQAGVGSYRNNVQTTGMDLDETLSNHSWDTNKNNNNDGNCDDQPEIIEKDDQPEIIEKDEHPDATACSQDKMSIRATTPTNDSILPPPTIDIIPPPGIDTCPKTLERKDSFLFSSSGVGSWMKRLQQDDLYTLDGEYSIRL